MKTIVKTEVKESLGHAHDNGWSWDEFVSNAHDDYLSVKRQALDDKKTNALIQDYG